MPLDALAGNLTKPAALELSIKYPRPETIVVTVEPSDVILDCQSVRLSKFTVPPSDTDSPAIVIPEFESLLFVIVESVNFALVTVPGAKLFKDYSKLKYHTIIFLIFLLSLGGLKCCINEGTTTIEPSCTGIGR